MSFERFFLWAMRNGARILFLMALLLVLAGLGPYLYLLLSETSRLAGNHQATSSMNLGLLSFATALFTSANSAALPFLGAVLIHLAARFLAATENMAATSGEVRNA